jgi:hypothetical protein
MKKHNLEYLKYVKNCVDLDHHISNKTPFSINMVYQSDNSSEDINLKIFGCLGCNTGLPNHCGAVAHCANDKCRVKHVSEMRKLRALLKKTDIEDHDEEEAAVEQLSEQ